MKAASTSRPVFSMKSVNWCCVNRYASRIRRLHRFLTTAFPSLLLATKATRNEPVLDGRDVYLKSKSLPRRNFPLPKRPAKAFFPLKMAVRGSRSRRIVTLMSILFRPPLIADRQAVTAFGAATTQYCASVSGLHARAETVRVCALTLAWLVRTFHVGLSGL
jgi:hypothetical protein